LFLPLATGIGESNAERLLLAKKFVLKTASKQQAFVRLGVAARLQRRALQLAIAAGNRIFWNYANSSFTSFLTFVASYW
jgi:hypothetical protein